MNVDGPDETSTHVQGASPDLSMSSAITDKPVEKEREGTIMDTQDDPNSTETSVAQTDQNEHRKVNDDVLETSSTEQEMSELEHVGGNVDNQMEVDGNEVTHSKNDVSGDKITNSQNDGDQDKVTNCQNDSGGDEVMISRNDDSGDKVTNSQNDIGRNKVTNSQSDSVEDAVMNSQNERGEDKVRNSQNDSGEDKVRNSQNDSGESKVLNPQNELSSTENEMSKVKDVTENHQTPENVSSAVENAVQQSTGEIVKDTHPTENVTTQHDTNDIPSESAPSGL